MTRPAPPTDRIARAEPMFHRILDANPAAVQQALIDVRRRFDGAVADDALSRMELVMAEILNNIAQHGTGLGKEPGANAPSRPPVTIHVTVTRHAGGLACAISDDGPPLPPDCLAAPDQPPSPEIAALRAGGFGWVIIRDLTRSLFYFRERSRNVLCFNIPRREDDIPLQGGDPSAERAAGAA